MMGSETMNKAFKCETCQKEFERSNHLIRHMMIHTGDKPYECDICQRSFARLDNLKSHTKGHHTGEMADKHNISEEASRTDSPLQMETHDEKKPFKCQTCGKRFDRQGKLKSHELTHIDEKPHNCNVCQRTFTWSDQLKTHMRDHHTGEMPRKHNFSDDVSCIDSHLQTRMQTRAEEKAFESETCVKGFDQEFELSHHELIHTGEKSHECTMCQRAFATSDGLQAHIKEHHTGEMPLKHNISDDVSYTDSPLQMETQAKKKPFKCQTCGKRFDRQGKLKSHELTHFDKKPHNCSVCQRTFAFSDQLKTHMRDHHPGENPYQTHMRSKTSKNPFKCQTCGKAFERESLLKRHEFTHTGEKPYKCTMCDKACARSDNLLLHIKSRHSGEIRHKCNVCQRAFTSSDQLETHIRDHHTGEKPYMRTKAKKNSFKCRTCGKGFDRERDVKYHVMIHTGEKPHKCNVCEKAFTRSDQLKSHMRTHTGEKYYKCNICFKIFAQNEFLQQHLKTHTEERWYLCSVCQKTFALSLERHPKTKTMRCVSCFQGNMPHVVDRYYFKSYSPEDDIDQHPEMPYGCGICDELFETEKEFVKHCYHHYTVTPHKDTFLDLLEIRHLSCYF